MFDLVAIIWFGLVSVYPNPKYFDLNLLTDARSILTWFCWPMRVSQSELVRKRGQSTPLIFSFSFFSLNVFTSRLLSIEEELWWSRLLCSVSLPRRSCSIGNMRNIDIRQNMIILPWQLKYLKDEVEIFKVVIHPLRGWSGLAGVNAHRLKHLNVWTSVQLNSKIYLQCIQNIQTSVQLNGQNMTLKSWASLVIFGGCGDREKGVLFSKSLEMLRKYSFLFS